MKETLPKNILNHADNLAHAHGFFYHGIYYNHGVPQISKEKMEKIKFKPYGVIYQKRINGK